MKLLIATTNQGKIKEYRHLLKEVPFELVTVAELGIKEKPEETGSTLEENALLKASFYFKKANFPVLADDMGLEIDVAALEQELELPVVPLVASRRQGLPELRQALERLDDLPAPARQWRMSDRMESAAQQMVASLQRNGHPDGGIALLEGLRLLGDEAGAIDDG